MGDYMISRSDEEINDTLNRANDLAEAGGVGASHAEGVGAGIRWLVGDTDDPLAD